MGRIVIKVAQWQPGKGLAFFVGISRCQRLRYQQCLVTTRKYGTRRTARPHTNSLTA
ncbi:hypothetical protein BVIET440_140064 [Burkholderia vietnamiensis]|nr:hypothetical protein BVI2075_80044 [Burkholderia vietnamiensis]